MSEPRYKEIAQELMAEITAGKYLPTGRLPSETQLVKRFEVSRPTAARALKMLQEQGLIERRAGAGTFVRQKPSTPQTGQQVIGILVPEMDQTEIMDLICGDLARLARLHDYNLSWGTNPEELTQYLTELDQDRTAQPPERRSKTPSQALELSRRICQPLLEQNVSGVFFSPFEFHPNSREWNLRIADRFRQAGVPVVLLDRDIYPFPNRSEFDLVGIDNFACGYLLATHLLKLGCQKLAFLGPPLAAPTITLRAAGAREAVHESATPEAKIQIFRKDPADASLVELSRQYDAVICSNDHVAVTVMQTLAQQGVAVPQQIRVVGFDDVKYAQILDVPLTTIHQPCRDIAMVAFRAMMDCIEKVSVPPRHYLLPGQLIVRESCGAYLPHTTGQV